MKVYELVSENLSNLGSSMGTEYTFTNWTKLFKSIASAKKFAETDYKKKIGWKRRGSSWTSGDLLYVMYTIGVKKIEE